MRLTIVVPLLTSLLLSTNLMAANTPHQVKMEQRIKSVTQSCQEQAINKNLSGKDYDDFIKSCTAK